MKWFLCLLLIAAGLYCYHQSQIIDALKTDINQSDAAVADLKKQLHPAPSPVRTTETTAVQPAMRPAQPATPPAEHTISVLGNDDFKKTLFSHTWSWLAAGVRNNLDLVFTFGADGIVTSSTGLKFHWDLVGPRMLKIEGSDGRAALLTFDESLTSFTSQGFDGKTKITGLRVDPIAVKAPIPSIPPSSPVISSKTSIKPAGIAIAGINEDRTSVSMATGGHSQEIEDLRALLSGYGVASADVGPHPEAEIYPGIPYLMPFREAEKKLIPAANTMMRSEGKIACAGFPDGLKWVCYDGTWQWSGGTYNHLYIVKDIRSQVVCVELRHGHASWTQPWPTLPGNWHLIDYVNAEVKGQRTILIDTQVLDERSSSHRIVVHTTNRKIDHAVTMFLPEPLINLILFVTRSFP